MFDPRKSQWYLLGVRLRRAWWKVKYFIGGEARRDKRERAAWARLAKKALQKRLLSELGKTKAERRAKLEDQVREAVRNGYLQSDRPYAGCMSEEHYDVIVRNRVVRSDRSGSVIYEVNTKGMESWEVDEFWNMLKDKTKLHKPKPIIREVISEKFPQ